MLCAVQSASAFISISASCTGTGEKAAEGCVNNSAAPQLHLCPLSPLSSRTWLVQEPLQGFLPGLPVRQQVKGLKGPQ